MRVEDQQRWINTYWVDGELPWRDDHYHVPLQRGDGYLKRGNDGRRFRVIDVWYSEDRHGAFDLGRHVFLEDVTGADDDRLGRMAPDYFQNED